MPITTIDLTLALLIHDRGTVTPSVSTVDFTLANNRFIRPPAFGGQTVRIKDGRTESRPYWVDVLDVNNDLTEQFDDGDGRMAMLGRIAELQIGEDGGALATVDIRRISNIQDIGEGWYSIELSDERWIERRTKLFEKTTSIQFHPSGLASAWLRKKAAGRGSYSVNPLTPDYVVLTVLPLDSRGGQLPIRVTTGMVTALRGDIVEARDRSIITGSFTSLRFEDDTSTDRPILRIDTSLLLGTPSVADLEQQTTAPIGFLLTGEEPEWVTILVYWPSHGIASSSTIRGRVHWSGDGVATSKDTPYLLGGEFGIRAPTLFEDIADGDHGGPAQLVDTAAIATLEADQFPTAWYSMDGPRPRAGWVEQHLCRPYAVVPFISAVDGSVAPRSLRTPQDVDPDTLFVFDHTNVIDQVVWQHPGREAITQVTLAARALVPLEVLGTTWHLAFPFTRQKEHDTLALLGYREQSLDLEAIFRSVDVGGIFEGLYTDLFERFGDAPQIGNFGAQIQSDSPVPGDLVVLDHDELQGPNPAVGARSGLRLVHIIERQRVYEDGGRVLYRYNYLDAGAAVQPFAPPDVSIAQTSGDEKHSVDITVSSVVTGATATIEIAHVVPAMSPVDADWFVAKTEVGNETIVVKERPSATDIYVRVFATKPAGNRSPRSSEDFVLTASMSPPTSVSATVAGRSVKVTCTLGETDELVAYLIDGTALVLLDEGTTQHTFHGLEDTLQTFGVRHADRFGGISTTATDTATPATPFASPDVGRITVEIGSKGDRERDGGGGGGGGGGGKDRPRDRGEGGGGDERDEMLQ